MLRDIKIEEKENSNIERLVFLINEQRKIYNEIKDEKRDFKSDERDLDDLIKQALAKKQWKLILLLLASPCPLSPKRINELAGYKTQIFSTENLNAQTVFGQNLLGDSLRDVDVKSTNISRLVYVKTGILSPQPTRLFGKIRAGALGRIHEEKFKREESNKNFAKKNADILDIIVRCAGLDATSANDKTLAKKAVSTLKKLLNQYLKSTDAHKYNPILLILEMYALLLDKGYNQPLKTKSTEFKSFKTHIGSPKLKGALGMYRGGYATHIKPYSEEVDFLSTVLHEFTHALCKMIYGNTGTRYQSELNQLAKNLQQYCKASGKKITDTLNFYDFYNEKKYADEIFPRIVQLFIIDPAFNAAVNYNEEIANSIGNLFSLFLKDIAEFKSTLLEAQASNKWSRKEISRALEIQDYKTFFTMLTPENQSQINVWPQLMPEDEKLFKGAAEKGFPMFAKNKFGKNSLKFAIETNAFESALDILRSLWQNKQAVPKNIDYNVTDKQGFTLLMRAITNDQEPAFIDWLIKEAGIDVSISNPITHKTALSYASHNKEIHSIILPKILTTLSSLSVI